MSSVLGTSTETDFPILSKYHETLSAFERLTRVAGDSPILTWQDQLGRLRVFASNVKVHRRLRNSLDFKLRDSSHLSTVVLNLLSGLYDTLEKSTSLYACNDSIRVAQSLGNEEVSETLQDAFEEIVESLDSLFDLAPTLQAPAPHDRLVDDLSSALPQTVKDIDIRHVHDKFPGASKVLAERLGTANWQRRVWLAHNQVRHAAKMKRLQESELRARRNVDSTYGSRATMSTTRSNYPSTLPTSTFDTAANSGEGDSDSGLSDASATSYNVTVTARHPDGPIRVPKPPEEYYKNQPFECPYCCVLLPDVHIMNAWKQVKHVMEDLSPYICTFGGCLQTETRFARRRLWFRHELQVHRSSWVCSHTDCGEEFSTSDHLEQHMTTSHQGTFGKKQLPAIMSLCRRGSTSPMKCPLCAKGFTNVEIFRRHLGGEMEELALFALPRTQDFGNDSETGNQSDDSSVASSLSQQRSKTDMARENIPDGENEIGTPVVLFDQRLAIGADVCYLPRPPVKAAEGIHCVIRNLLLDKRPIVYEVAPIGSFGKGIKDIFKAAAADLIPIPETVGLATFDVGKLVLAQYPSTGAFYKAKVLSLRDNMYYLHFENDKTDSEVWVEKRFVLCEMVLSNLPHEASPDEKPATLDPLLPGLSATGSVQQLSKPNNPEEFVRSLQGFMASIGQTVNVHPVICEQGVNVMQLFVAVVKHGGSARVTKLNQWPYVGHQLGFPPQSIAAQELRVYWMLNLAPYENMWQMKKQTKTRGQGQGLPLITGNSDEGDDLEEEEDVTSDSEVVRQRRISAGWASRRLKAAQATIIASTTLEIDDTERRNSESDASHLPKQPRAADTTGQVKPPGSRNRVSATLWEEEGTRCFEVESRGICVARREDNHMINGTKLLNAAGLTRERIDTILKNERTRHIVKTGPMHLKGVWIPFERALDFSNQYKITESLYPLFVHNVGGLLYNSGNASRTSAALAPSEPTRTDE